MADKEIVKLSITDNDLLEVERSEEGVALQAASFLWDLDDYREHHGYFLSTGVGVSATFHRLVDECSKGKTTFREIAAICFLAGRLSIGSADAG